MESPRRRERRACCIWKAEEVASGRNWTLSYDATISARPSMHTAASARGSHEGLGIGGLAGDTPMLLAMAMSMD